MNPPNLKKDLNERHVANISVPLLGFLLLVGWQFALVPCAFLYGLGLMGLITTDPSWGHFFGALVVTTILRSSVKSTPWNLS